MWFARPTPTMPTRATALPDRASPILLPARHAATGASLNGPWPPGAVVLSVGMGCFWGAERLFWRLPGVLSTAVGYQGGFTAHPTYADVCSGRTGHTEVVRIVFDPTSLAVSSLWAAFWEGHDPTQGHRQGNDVGTQYRSALFVPASLLSAAEASRAAYQDALTRAGRGTITTEIAEAGPFYAAEPEHQQYLHHNPNGYCGLAGTGVACPAGVGVAAGAEPG